MTVKQDGKKGWHISLWLLLAGFVWVAHATGINKVEINPLPNERVRFSLYLDGALKQNPRSFAMQHPDRIVLDLPGVTTNVPATQLGEAVHTGALESYQIVQAGSRTRLILNLSKLVKFTTEKHPNRLDILLAGDFTPKRSVSQSQFQSLSQLHAITGVDFRGAGNQGGKLVIDLAHPDTVVDIQQQGKTLALKFQDTAIAQRLLRRLDVKDFASPVQIVDISRQNRNILMTLHTEGDYEYLAYQVDRKFIVDVTPRNQSVQARLQAKDKVYKGKRISLNFQDISVRSVLQILADFTKLNIVVSDSVTGNITLNLNNIPWDQALDIILKTRGLDKRQLGAVLLIAPATEIAEQEKQELSALKDVQELAPLQSELIQVNYAKATELSKLLKDQGNSLLSQRGSVSVDTRTNTLWVQDTAQQIDEVRGLIRKLDVPVRQVLIEARIVIVDKSFEQDLGLRFGITNPNHLTGSLDGASQLVQGTAPADIGFVNRLNVNLPAPDSVTPARLGLALAKLGSDILLDLELSALESEGMGEVISSPRLITANQQPATIESGEEIPYQEATSSGATAVAFKKAVLALRVTPQITPDNKIILNLQVNQDTAGTVTFNGVPSIQTREIETNVLIDNGQTVVLGGIYKQEKRSTIKRIPFLGDIPFVGVLFRNKNISTAREELLIFITPKIIESTNDNA